MRKTAAVVLFVFFIFLLFDSFGPASWAQIWLPIPFAQTSDPSMAIKSPAEKIEVRFSLNDLFDYKSYRRIQTSA